MIALQSRLSSHIFGADFVIQTDLFPTSYLSKVGSFKTASLSMNSDEEGGYPVSDLTVRCQNKHREANLCVTRDNPRLKHGKNPVHAL
jgi:hypothetical protein